MKRTRLLILFLILSLSHLPLFAQDATAASEIAAKQEAEERYKRLSADVESLLAANVALQKKISALDAELQKVREEQSQLRSANNNDTQETVKKLADAIQEVDKNRESDKKEILKELANLGKKFSAAPLSRSKPVVEPENSGPDKGYPYTIQSGDTLLAVLADFNAQFKAKGMKAVTMSQVMAANPNVDWKKLKIGQKIFIPAPE
jgi:LysM repeat protein